MEAMQDYLKQCNAFSEHTEATLKMIPRNEDFPDTSA